MSRSLPIVALALAGCLAPGLALPEGATGNAPVDFAGMWLPDARRAEPWPAQLPLTPATRQFMESFDPTVSDPTTFCMPLGTPRNMLQTGYPLEIVQTSRRLVMIVQPNLANAEVRRITLDGEFPDSVEPSWFGTSRGRWEGKTLVVETIGMRPDAIVGENGLPHSGELHVTEQLRIVEDAERGRVLIDDIELRDPQSYLEPINIRRYYSWAPDARPVDPTCVDAMWMQKLWRDRLREHAEAARGKGGSQ